MTIVVSEETGQVSICIDGKIERNLEEDAFRERLEEIFLSDSEVDDNEEGLDEEGLDEEGLDEEIIREQLDSEDRVATGGDRSMVSD